MLNNLVEIYDFDNKNIFHFMVTNGKYMLGLTKDLVSGFSRAY